MVILRNLGCLSSDTVPLPSEEMEEDFVSPSSSSVISGSGSESILGRKHYLESSSSSASGLSFYKKKMLFPSL